MNLNNFEKGLILFTIIAAGLMSIAGWILTPYQFSESDIWFDTVQYLTNNPISFLVVGLIFTLSMTLIAIPISIFVIYFKRFADEISSSNLKSE